MTKTRAQAFNGWLHGLNGDPLAGLDVGEAFRAGWDAHSTETQPVIDAARIAIRAQGVEYGKAMLALTDALIAYGRERLQSD